ncbi:MAG: hypothetical protein IJ282_06245 [Lachnospiraceae bacterium]|nr:hypothetical protein [Lachnospiraceae bacterium]
MKSNLLTEIQQILEKKDAWKGNLPIPNYLFVQRYGRDIIEEMPQIAALFGQTEWFVFDDGAQQKEGSILSHFKMELNRHAGIGRDYSGSILMELPSPEEEKEEKELEELLNYIDCQKNHLHCVYTMREERRLDSVKKQLENYGFVRVVYAKPYSTDEQMEIFLDTLQEYQFQADTEAKLCMEAFLEGKKWDTSDAVKIRIENIAKEIVYCSFINGEVQDNIVHKEEIEQVLASLAKEMTKKRQIGFVIGGTEV